MSENIKRNIKEKLDARIDKLRKECLAYDKVADGYYLLSVMYKKEMSLYEEYFSNYDWATKMSCTTHKLLQKSLARKQNATCLHNRARKLGWNVCPDCDSDGIKLSVK